MKILMIEDNYDDLAILNEHFKKHKDYQVVHSDSLRKSVENFSNEDIDLIFLDLYLPDSRGIDTLIKLKSSFKSIPIIILTEINDAELAVKALNYGAQDYIEKQDLTASNLIRIIKYSIERNKNMKEIENMNIKLIELNSKKNEFLSIASHDLRTPLSTIYTLSEMLLTQLENDEIKPEKLSKSLNMINDSSRKILDLVNYFLDISRIESEEIELSIKKIDYIQLIHEVVSILSNLSEKKSIHIKIEKSIESIMVMIDAGKIEQVLNNIITNGIKYSRENSSITINVYTKSDFLITTITDTGIGIPENKIGELFNPYKRANKPTGGEKSIGLGLAIAKKIIQAHNGEIGVSSIQEKGSTFYFSLPLK
ncbi:MAG: hypothetical protein A2015_14910 [Spirochaetes bacterium GWF1_31_7]|nr:MAG: hypothetical protein A2Y30_12170 [Spirochaetes bacterium GWE1_32_154]OHD49438.1 MAG: hypothetical protein A2015_14910 [Spirochaetes bacterium GWF1_31_7]OHD52024.1 MAG: hypothetical protein A2Y29_14950 [Spirochaetes bacterium GWE2_31_10]HBD93635.1 hypothetical protein [Spirochaetia bacterium]HBI37972.1 hypothetical protein [Spirochaetia bacterium]